MGLVKKGNFLYLQAKKGYLHQWDKDTEQNILHKGYEGTLVGLREKNATINDSPQLQFEVRMQDPESDQIAVITFSAESYLTLTFFQRLDDLNLNKPFTFSVWPGKDTKGNVPTYANVVQDGKQIGKFENGVDPYPDYPKPVYNKKASGKTEADWDAVIERVREQIENVQSQLGGRPVEKVESAEVSNDDEQIPF